MPPIGETLREARLRRSVDIAEVSASTKIRTKYLRALETEEFDQLPGPTYVRTFLRTYAEYLGLDAHLLVEEYRTQHQGPTEDEPITPFAPPPGGRRAREGGGLRPPPRPPGGVGTIAAGLAVAIILVFLLIGVFTDPEPSRVQPTAPPASAPATTATKGGKAERPKPPKVNPDKVELSIAPDGPTYLCVDDGAGNVVFEDTIDKTKTFSGKVLRINMGRAAGTVKNGGDLVKIPEGPDPVGYEFTPGKTRPLADGDRPCQ
ncbi:MAG: cytoskeleton protein RodZ [Thermoleophilaceae bacterium]|jgi:cytoskeletal protein RodZ|nr:cytoskeleton protein RodZ [Thermoleophilaceae bacterium]